MNFILSAVSGFTLGCLHAFDADHITAVTVFATKSPDRIKAVRFGVLWGLGHTATLLVLGVATAMFKFVIPPPVQSAGEILVGLLLVAIGAWSLNGVLRRKDIHLHTHAHDGVEHSHFHSHRQEESHLHHHSMFAIGAAHGLAGTASVMVIVPLTIAQSLFAVGAYLLLFGLGTILAMSAFAFMIGSLSTSAGKKGYVLRVRGLAGAASVIVGILWIGQKVF